MPLLFLVAAEEKSLAVLRSPLDLLADRSPGERDAGALYTTKPPRKTVSAPSERVLATVRDRPLLPPPAEPLLESEPLVPEEPLFVTELALMEPPLIIVDTLPGPIVPPQLVQEVPDVPLVDPGAVPEPATWLTMIVGLFGIAAMIRRSNRGRMAATAEAVSPTC